MPTTDQYAELVEEAGYECYCAQLTYDKRVPPQITCFYCRATKAITELQARVRELEAELELEHRKDHAYASYMAGYEDGARDVLVLRKRMTDDERDAFIHEWFKRREWAEDCTCNEDGLDSGCWYHLTPHEKSEERARSLIRLFNDLREVQLEGEVAPLREQVRELRDIARDVAIHDCESWDCDHLYSGEPTPNLDKVCIPTRARNALAKPEGVQR